MQEQVTPATVSGSVKDRVTGFIESVVPSRLNSGARLFLTGAIVNGIGNGVMNSVMQLYLISVGYDAVALGQIGIFNPLACALFSIPCGIAADRYGKRKMIILGFLSVFIGVLFFLFAQDLTWYAAAFFLFGLSNASGTVLTPLYSSFYDKEDLDKAFGLYGLINISAMSLGNLAGFIPAYMISNLAFTEQYSYLIVLLFAAILFNAQYFFYYISSRGMTEKLREGFDFKLKSWRPVLKFSALYLFGNIAGGMFFALFPYYVHQKFGIASAGLGTLFFISNLSMAASKGLAASVAKRLGNLKSIITGLALSSVFFFLMPLSPSFGLLSLLYVLRSGSRFMSEPILMSLFLKSISEDELSTANSIRMISINGGGMVSPLLGGRLMDNIGLGAPAFIGAGLTVVLAGLYPVLLSREIHENSKG